jgi:hypothetical protein
MKTRISPLTVISLFALISLAVLKIPRLTQAAFASTSQKLVQDRVGEGAPESCPVTKPPDPPFIPPAPYPTKITDSFWFGTQKLWTYLPNKAAWNGLPHYSPSDPTFRQKIFFWHNGYNLRIEPRPHLIVTGRRLDATVPPLVFGGANNGWTDDKEHPFIVTGVNFPTLGCWEVAGDYHGDKLTFVVWLGP